MLLVQSFVGNLLKFLRNNKNSVIIIFVNFIHIRYDRIFGFSGTILKNEWDMKRIKLKSGIDQNRGQSLTFPLLIIEGSLVLIIHNILHGQKICSGPKIRVPWRPIWMSRCPVNPDSHGVSHTVVHWDCTPKSKFWTKVYLNCNFGFLKSSTVKDGSNGISGQSAAFLTFVLWTIDGW